MHDPHVILKVISKFLVPFIALFAFYVQFHGDFGPGGGFQAGVILASAVILYALIFGLEAAKKAFPPELGKNRYVLRCLALWRHWSSYLDFRR